MAGCLIGKTVVFNCVATFLSSSVASPARNFLFSCAGNIINLERYSLRRCAFTNTVSTDLLRLRLSTETPIDLAYAAFNPAA